MMEYTKIMINWLSLRVEEMERSRCKDIYKKAGNNWAEFTRDWVLIMLEDELGFSPRQVFDLDQQPHLHQIDLMSFAIDFTNEGLKSVDWIAVGYEFCMLLGNRLGRGDD